MLTRNRARVFAAAFVAVCAAPVFAGCGASGYHKYTGEFSGLFDTQTVIVGYAKSEKAFNKGAQAFYDEMARLHREFDIYDEYDGINNLKTINDSAGIAPVAVSEDIIELLEFSKEGYNTTGGAVNVALGAVLAIWHEYREAGLFNPQKSQLPNMVELQAAAALTDINDVIIDADNSTVYLSMKGMSLDVGAVAKAFAEQKAAGKMAAAGVINVLISAGGSVTALEEPRDGVRARWGVGIQDPALAIDGINNITDTVYINNNTVSCSGGYQRFYKVGGQTYCHIIDPTTLMPADRYAAVTVICEDSALADLLSTAVYILPYEDGRALIEGQSAEALWIGWDGALTATDGYRAISKELGGYSAVDK